MTTVTTVTTTAGAPRPLCHNLRGFGPGTRTAITKKIGELYRAEAPAAKNQPVINGVMLVPFDGAVVEGGTGLLWEAVRAKEVRNYEDATEFLDVE